MTLRAFATAYLASKFDFGGARCRCFVLGGVGDGIEEGSEVADGGGCGLATLVV
jgi:hypothetical protein